MKATVLMALIASTSAITLTNAPVGAGNFPGVILAGHTGPMPVKSSFVDDDFNPMFNKFRYGGTLAQTRHETRQKLSKELH